MNRRRELFPTVSGLPFPVSSFLFSSFSPAAPTDLEVTRLLAAVRRRIIRLVKRHGIDPEQPTDEVHALDERLLECPVYAEMQGAAVTGRVATGPRAGRAVLRVGRDLYAAAITPTG